MTTANTARDLDRVREALGEKKISYYGVSYDSYLGAAYASMFPGRTDRVVLDSVLGPTGLDYRAQLRFAEGFDDRFAGRDWAGQARTAAGPLDGDNHATRRAVEDQQQRHPMFSPPAANVNPCAFWSVERTEPPVRVGGPGPANVLLVRNRRDSATPLSGARETRAAPPAGAAACC